MADHSSDQASAPLPASDATTATALPGDVAGDTSEEGADGADGDKRMSLLEHLNELRFRLRNAFIAFFISMIVAFAFQEEIFELLTRPVREGMKAAGRPLELVITSITEAFWVYFKLSMVAGILISAPLVFWELWKFVAPGLYRKEKRMALLVVTATGGCFSGGALFGYFLLIKPAAYFLLSYVTELKVSNSDDGVPNALKTPVKLMLTLENVADFETMMLLGCGLAFEMPVVVSILGALGIVSSRSLWKFNKYALILSALLGGILTPGPDVVSQLLLAGPIFVLYNISIGIVFLVERARKKKIDALETD